MRGNTHIAIGLASAIGLQRLFQLPLDPAGVCLCVIGALLPDIDEPNSTVARPGNLLFPYLPRPFIRSLNFAARFTAFVVHKLFGHRSVTHWPFLAGVLLFVSLRSGSVRLLMLSAGYWSHLLADLCTKQGIPFWAPLSSGNISLCGIKVGGATERVLAMILWLGLVCYGLTRYGGRSLLP